jgi:hypothetical protein
MNSLGRHKTAALRIDAALRPSAPTHAAGEAITVNLAAAILGVRAAEPVVAVVPGAEEESLPCGPFRPSEHGTLERGARAWVDTQAGVQIALLEQLHADSDIAVNQGSRAFPHAVSISFLALVGPGQCNDRTRATWRSWYAFFPWEDWRHGKPACLNQIEQNLDAWALEPCPPRVSRQAPDRVHRVRIAFGASAGWDEEKVLERYQLLQEAGLVGQEASRAGPSQRPTSTLRGDHALILARAIGDLRRAVKCRPVVFELMQEQFTLFELQRTVEAILGPHLHKQNFRRLVESCGLVEPVGDIRLRTGGRPARLYRFRRDVLLERPSPGVRLKPGRAAFP